MNTKIEYLYRDASNYKTWNECVVKGVLSEKQKQTILNALDSGEFFIPSQVGLPERRFDELNEDDHCWFELQSNGITLTNDKPTVNMTAEDLARAFELSKDNWQDGVCFAPAPKLPLGTQIASAAGQHKDQIQTIPSREIGPDR